ncbi:response regulator [Leptolyngbya sp. FACHB-17]|uniref:response regulator n=1 Tax=unclassified Leptolyngbya TaxID=2650499 RepID=UPI001680CE84|nr:response regulator [Leptolyngbya sp. FACHB-17]MBD2081790.1 response regulator [Leptolyngbya sp. FACHB-17]
MEHSSSQVSVTGKKQAHQTQLLAGVKVLLVEDECDVADLLLFILSEAGAEAIWVTQANDALAQLHRSRPDILLSNIRLPDRNGNWLIQEIRQAEFGRMARLPAIAVTSYTREFNANKVLESGFDRFLPKHIDPEEIISAILDLV